MSNKDWYVIDDYGNKAKSMTKDEILESIGAGGERENVFTGDVMYNAETVDYSYTGVKPSDDIVLKLLKSGLEPNNNYFTQTEIEDIAALPDFTIHYYYSDGELYVSNRNDNSIKFFKEGIGVMTLYPRKKEIEYYVKSNKKMDNIYFCTQEEYDNIPHYENTTYIIEDAEFAVDNSVTSESAYEVTDKIKGMNISDIFQYRLGNITTQVKSAHYADSANTAGTANYAIFKDNTFKTDEGEISDYQFLINTSGKLYIKDMMNSTKIDIMPKKLYRHNIYIKYGEATNDGSLMLSLTIYNYSSSLITKGTLTNYLPSSNYMGCNGDCISNSNHYNVIGVKKGNTDTKIDLRCFGYSKSFDLSSSFTIYDVFEDTIQVIE